MTSTPRQISTDRLVLRRWRDSDLDPFATINSDPDVMRCFPDSLDRVDSDAFVERIELHFDHHGFGLWAVEFEGRLAGFTGLNHTTYATPMGEHVEIGWRLATWAWHRGIATEAARAALHDAFDRVGLSVVYSFTTTTNQPSERVMLRLGMTRRPELDFDHPRTPGWWGQRHIVYSATP